MVKSALIECIPNLSEGRDLDRLESLATTLSAIPDLQLLQSHCDADHHRSVWTLAGSPHALEQAIDHLYQFAHQHIDLRHHQGAHPRIGALDVVPFVPLRGITRAETVLWADALAQKMATQWHLPIYLYEYSARSDHRRSLPTLRQGGTTGLEKRLQTDPNWLPDYGPSYLHPQLGATVWGVRPPLIAWNIQLESEDLALAQACAKTLRESNGGIPGLRAIGVALPSQGCVQVSMNLVNYHSASFFKVLNAIKAYMAPQGVAIRNLEFVGLVPAQALIETAVAWMGGSNWQPGYILESHLELPYDWEEA